MKIVIVGIPGVGKTSVVDGALQLVKKEIKKFRWGDLVEEIALKKQFVQNRDYIRKLDRKTQRKLQELVVKRLQRLTSNNDSIIETHAAIKTPSGYLPGLDLESLNALKPDAFVVIETDAEAILERRRKDTSRIRDDDKSQYEIQLHLDITRYFTASFSVISGANLYIVKNDKGKLDWAIHQLTNILNNLTF